MLLTEQEAAKTWCPHRRQAHAIEKKTEEGYGVYQAVGAAGVNWLDSGPLGSCIGSRCSQWRWANQAKRTRGYCGLAGPVHQ